MIETLLKNEQFKLKREIKTNGRKYVFKRYILNEYKEPTEETEVVCEVEGLFHVTKGYITRNSSDSTTTKSKSQPMLMSLHEDAEKIENGMFTIINNSIYKVVSVDNIGEYNIIDDVSLELVIDD